MLASAVSTSFIEKYEGNRNEVIPISSLDQSPIYVFKNNQQKSWSDTQIDRQTDREMKFEGSFTLAVREIYFIYNVLIYKVVK